MRNHPPTDNRDQKVIAAVDRLVAVAVLEKDLRTQPSHTSRQLGIATTLQKTKQKSYRQLFLALRPPFYLPSQSLYTPYAMIDWGSMPVGTSPIPVQGLVHLAENIKKFPSGSRSSRKKLHDYLSQVVLDKDAPEQVRIAVLKSSIFPQKPKQPSLH